MQWHFSATTLTAVFAVYVLALLLTLLAFGSLSDYLGRRRVIAVALAAGAGACGLFLAAHGVGLLFAARALQGVAAGIVTSAAGAALIDLQPDRSTRSGPRGGEGIGALPARVAELFTRKYERQEDMWLPILFSPTETSQAAGRAYVERIVARADRDVPVSDQSIAAQGAALAAYGAAKDPSYAPGLTALGWAYIDAGRWDEAQEAALFLMLFASAAASPLYGVYQALQDVGVDRRDHNVVAAVDDQDRKPEALKVGRTRSPPGDQRCRRASAAGGAVQRLGGQAFEAAWAYGRSIAGRGAVE
jgi:Major Facilitator Superfamily